MKIALRTNSAITMENLAEIGRRIEYSKEMNGRLHRWNFRKMQKIVECKAWLNGIEVLYIDPHKTSSCPICGEKAEPEWSEDFEVQLRSGSR